MQCAKVETEHCTAHAHSEWAIIRITQLNKDGESVFQGSKLSLLGPENMECNVCLDH